MKKLVCAALACVFLLTACGKTATNVTSETSAATETTVSTYSEEELNALAEDMPEIVFVDSYSMYDTNIYGYFITNTGEMKMFDFRQIAPDEHYEIPDVIDRLDEAVCEKIDLLIDGVYWGDTLYDYQLNDIPNEELTELYKKLLLVDESKLYNYVNNLDSSDYNVLYGIRRNCNNEVEVQILTGIDKEYCYDHNDINGKKLINLLSNKYFPTSNDFDENRSK